MIDKSFGHVINNAILILDNVLMHVRYVRTDKSSYSTDKSQKPFALKQTFTRST